MPKEKKDKKDKKEKKETKQRGPTPDYILREYAAPENPETEPKKDRENRLKNKRNAKYRYYQTLEEGNSGPSTRTRSRTSKASKALSDTRSKTKEGQRDRQQAYRASLRYCSLDEYQEEMEGEKPGLCCMNGEVVLAPLQTPLSEINYFLTEKDPISKVPFVDQIRVYNQAFAFTSIATDLDLSVANEKKGHIAIEFR
ncbi:2486_t:CDS:2, partial [Dentiscutata erythropus]